MAALKERSREWNMLLLAIGYELAMTLSFLADTKGVVALKHLVKLTEPYAGDLQAELKSLEWQIPGNYSAPPGKSGGFEK